MPVHPLLCLIRAKLGRGPGINGGNQVRQLLPKELLHRVLAVQVRHPVREYEFNGLGKTLVERCHDGLRLIDTLVLIA